MSAISEIDKICNLDCMSHAEHSDLDGDIRGDPSQDCQLSCD